MLVPSSPFLLEIGGQAHLVAPVTTSELVLGARPLFLVPNFPLSDVPPGEWPFTLRSVGAVLVLPDTFSQRRPKSVLLLHPWL